MSIEFPLNPQGFVLNWMTCGERETDFVPPHTDKDQLKFEHDMRQIIASSPFASPPLGTLGELSDIGMPWRYYFDNHNIFIDFSKFYYTLKKIDFYAQTLLLSPIAQTVKARIWTYCAADMWLNGERVAGIAAPVYQPIGYVDAVLNLRSGVNSVFAAMQNFGVRDTRNIFALQLCDAQNVTTTLPIAEETLSILKEAENWFASLTLDGDGLICPYLPPFAVTAQHSGESFVWEKSCRFAAENAESVSVSATVEGQTFCRIIELSQNIAPVFRKFADENEYINTVLKSIEIDPSSQRGQLDGVIEFIRRYLLNGEILASDYSLLDASLGKVNERVDCSDFSLASLLRIYKTLPLADEYKEKIKAACLAFRYWMNEDGADAMCFWSENHSLLFHACQMLAGELWPDETFKRSAKPGLEMYTIGKRRTLEWLDAVEKEGFEEFCANGYMAVTIFALQLVYDFAEATLSKRAGKLIDQILEENARQCFKGVQFSPMGRVYRKVLHPFRGDLQALLYALNDEAAYHACTWQAPIFLSDYKAPSNLKECMSEPVDISFNSGSAMIYTYKTDDYILTSAASPRKMPLVEGIDKKTEYYKTKIMNEGFHGTTLFVPNGHGYQQHLWTAAISPKAPIFVNHPGVERDFSSNRPGYWYGNGVFPAITQDKNRLYCLYEIPATHPIQFTHLYWPSWIMQEQKIVGNWIFGRCENGYIGIWCSASLELNNTDAVINADYRAFGTSCAWAVHCGSQKEHGSFDEFVASCSRSKYTLESVRRIL